jgi:hypothetical protein
MNLEGGAKTIGDAHKFMREGGLLPTPRNYTPIGVRLLRAPKVTDPEMSRLLKRLKSGFEDFDQTDRSGEEEAKQFNKKAFSRSLRGMIKKDPRAAVLDSLGQGDVVKNFKDQKNLKKDLIDYAADMVGDALALHEKSRGPTIVVVPIEKLPGSGGTGIIGPLVTNLRKALSRHQVNAVIWRAEFGDVRTGLRRLAKEGVCYVDNNLHRYLDTSITLEELINEFHALREKWLSPANRDQVPEMAFFFVEMPGTLTDFDPEAPRKLSFQVPMGGNILRRLASLTGEHSDYFMTRAVGIAPTKKILETAENNRFLIQRLAQAMSNPEVRDELAQNLKALNVIEDPYSLADMLTKNATCEKTRAYQLICLVNILYFFQQHLVNPEITLADIQTDLQQSIARYIEASFLLSGIDDFIIVYNSQVNKKPGKFHDDNATLKELPPICEVAGNLAQEGKLLQPIR